MKQEIPALISEYKYREAFWAAADEVMTDEDTQQYFLSIVNNRWRLVNLREDVEKIEQLAESGNPYMKLAFARLHDLLQFDSDSLDICLKYYKEAADEGLADALAYLAWLEGSGALGEKDTKMYHELLDKALDNGSSKAVVLKLNNLLYGLHDISQDTEKVKEVTKTYIDQCVSEGSVTPDFGVYYTILADAYEQEGNKEMAAVYNMQAAKHGQNTAFYNLALCKYLDDQCQITDRDEFDRLMTEAMDANDPRGYLRFSFVLNQELYESLDDDEKKECGEAVIDEYQHALYYGESIAAYLLGNIYEEGLYGIDVSHAKAFSYYSLGARLFDSYCYEALYRMIIIDKTASDQYDKDFGYECAYRAMLFGANTLNDVIGAYQQGYLTHHAAAIEQYYLPQYESMTGEYGDNDSDDDDYDDEEDHDHADEHHSGFNFEFPEYFEPHYDDADSKTKTQSQPHEDLYLGLCDSSRPEDMTTDEGMQLLEQYINEIHDIQSVHGDSYLITDLIKKYIRIAYWLKGYDHYTNSLYSTNKEMLDLIYEHPRLKLIMLYIQLDVLHDIEAQSGAPHTLSITEEVMEEIDHYSKCISLADQGKLDEIPQTGHLKHDPIEWTIEWERVIDDADHEAYGNLEGVPRGMGWCFWFWHERAAALRKRGVDWRNPHLMNPRVMFD